MVVVVVEHDRLRQVDGLLLDEEDVDALDHSDMTAVRYPEYRSVMMMVDVGAAETALAAEAAVMDIK